MSFSLSTLSPTANSNIQNFWPSDWIPITNDSQKFIAAIADAFADSFSAVLQNTKIIGGTIIGGTAPPGGPVVGATLILSSGSLVMASPQFQLMFVPPDYTVNTGDQQRHGSDTAWHKAFIQVLDQALTQSLSLWTPTWTQPAGQAGGGIAGWIASIPPAPGPWVNGTIIPFTFLGQGLNPSPAISLLSDTFALRAQVTPVIVKTDDKRTEEVELGSLSSRLLLDAVAKGLSQTILDSFSKILVKDPVSSGSAAGIAAPGGAVSGTIPTLVLDVM